MWRIHNSSGNFPSLTTTVAIWHDEWITRLLVLFYFKSISNFFFSFSCTWKITIWQSLQPPQPPRVYQLRPSIPQGRVYQQLHLRDLIKGAPSVKPWETVRLSASGVFPVPFSIFFFNHLDFFFLGVFFIVHKFRGHVIYRMSFFMIYRDVDLPEFLTLKMLLLYLAKQTLITLYFDGPFEC